MTTSEYRKIKQTLVHALITVNTLKDLEDHGGAKTTKTEMVDTIIAQLKEI